jgi:5'-nucleotidase
MGYDAITFGNHEFDLEPDGLGKAIGTAAKDDRVPRCSSRTATSRRMT